MGATFRSALSLSRSSCYTGRKQARRNLGKETGLSAQMSFLAYHFQNGFGDCIETDLLCAASNHWAKQLLLFEKSGELGTWDVGELKVRKTPRDLSYHAVKSYPKRLLFLIFPPKCDLS